MVIRVIKIYQFIISPFLGKNCRYIPSCSQYTIESIKKNGIYYGIITSLGRILRCNPLSRRKITDEVKKISNHQKIFHKKIIVLFSIIFFLAYYYNTLAEEQTEENNIKEKKITTETKQISAKNQRKLDIIKKIGKIREVYILNQDIDIKGEIYQKIQNINIKKKPYNKFARKKIPYSILTDSRDKKNRHIQFLLKEKHLISGAFNAIYEDNNQGFLAFLKKLKNPNIINIKTGETLLTEAIKLKRKKIIQYLIAFGLNLDKPNSRGETPVHIAINMKKTNILSTLLQFGADRNIVDKNGNTYLMQAINIAHIPTIKTILDAGVPNAYAVNKNELTALDMAYIGKKQITIKLLENYKIFRNF